LAIAFGYPEETAEGTRNAAALIGADGETVLDYAKTHLWGDLDRAQFVAGRALSPVVDLGGWKVALAICFDIEFPELARALSLSGAEVILVPTACAEPWVSAPLRLVPARAEENGIFVAYANYVGREPGNAYCGHSCVAGPGGEDLARAAREPAVIVADLDRVAIEKRRAAIPYLDQRLPGLYGPLARD
jgi:predicted amidohydrolase